LAGDRCDDDLLIAGVEEHDGWPPPDGASRLE
jgi:hypothetical protein